MIFFLRDTIKGIGKKGEVLSVKTGYARNYLIPSKLAYEFCEGNAKRFEQDKKNDALKDLKIKSEAEEAKKEIEKISITIAQKAHDDDVLYGSVTSAMIAEELAKSFKQADKHSINLDEPIKKLGTYTVAVKLHQDVSAELKVWVVKDE